MNNNQQLGRWGEKAAADYLIKKGYVILFQNWRSPFGELDIIAIKKETISIIEVKTRRGITHGWPEESVTTQKQEHLINASQAFFEANESYAKYPWQIDVIAILIENNYSEAFQIKHYENAISDL
jgi:putative endonuclease